jgi:hypothetical protein
LLALAEPAKDQRCAVERAGDVVTVKCADVELVDRRG